MRAPLFNPIVVVSILSSAYTIFVLRLSGLDSFLHGQVKHLKCFLLGPHTRSPKETSVLRETGSGKTRKLPIQEADSDELSETLIQFMSYMLVRPDAYMYTSLGMRCLEHFFSFFSCLRVSWG